VTITPALPTAKRKRVGFDPRAARVVLAGEAGVGKTSLAAHWPPDSTLIIDTHGGTDLLDGEHYIAKVSTFQRFTQVVDELLSTENPYKTVVIDLIEDVWTFAKREIAQANDVEVVTLIGYNKGVDQAEERFRKQIDRLVASHLGIWFLTHTDTRHDEQSKQIKYVPELDKRVRPYVMGLAQFVWLAEAHSPTHRVLHTQPSVKFGCKSRVKLTDPMPLSEDETTAKRIYTEMAGAVRPPDPEPEIFDPNTEE
jgi:hypothetical protein